MSELFAKAVHYRYYRRIKRFFHYDDDITNELKKITKKITVPMKDHSISVENLVSTIASLQGFKVACDASNIHDRAAMWLFKHYISGRVKAVIVARVTVPTKRTKSKQGCLISFSAIRHYLLERFATDSNIATVDANLQNNKQRSSEPTD